VVVVGSLAGRYHGVNGALPRDIDVPVVRDGIDRADLYDSAERGGVSEDAGQPGHASSGLTGGAG
jgi:hypothetical protein